MRTSLGLRIFHGELICSESVFMHKYTEPNYSEKKTHAVNGTVEAKLVWLYQSSGTIQLCVLSVLGTVQQGRAGLKKTSEEPCLVVYTSQGSLEEQK